MSAPFVTSLRSRPGVVRTSDHGGTRLTLRVQMPDVWDTVVVEAAAEDPVRALKEAALAALWPDAEYADDFVLKLRGIEVLDESVPIADTGAIEGSIFLLTFRRRRPVR